VGDTISEGVGEFVVSQVVVRLFRLKVVRIFTFVESVASLEGLLKTGLKTDDLLT
jgi:hypothetical protein